MENLESRFLLFSTIILLGALTTYTDIRKRKIFNPHLMIFAVLGCLMLTYLAIFRHYQVRPHIENGLIAFIIGFMMYKADLWRGGDAKLFTLLALLMPSWEHDQVFFSNTISLFACSFIAGMLLLLPELLKTLITDRKKILKTLYQTKKNLFGGTVRIIFFSWVMFPLYHQLSQYIPDMVNIIFVIAYIYIFIGFKFFNSHYDFDIYIKKYGLVFLIGLIFGLLVRIWFYPHALNPEAFGHSMIKTLTSILISAALYTSISLLKDYRDRVPFAPLMFIGCLLSYSPFLSSVIRLMSQWNNLFYN